MALSADQNVTEQLRQISVDFAMIAHTKRNINFKNMNHTSEQLDEVFQSFEDSIEAHSNESEYRANSIFKELGYTEEQCEKALELLKYNFLYYVEYHFELTLGLSKYK